MEKKKDWDYRSIARCGFSVGGYDCDEPAAYEILWEEGTRMPICKDHLDQMIAEEDE